MGWSTAHFGWHCFLSVHGSMPDGKHDQTLSILTLFSQSSIMLNANVTDE
jgi:hypothetical protein